MKPNENRDATSLQGSLPNGAAEVPESELGAVSGGFLITNGIEEQPMPGANGKKWSELPGGEKARIIQLAGKKGVSVQDFCRRYGIEFDGFE